jgi:hypothetical protein
VWDIHQWVDYTDQRQFFDRASGDPGRFGEHYGGVCAVSDDLAAVGDDELTKITGQHLRGLEGPTCIILAPALFGVGGASGTLGAQSFFYLVQVGWGKF